MWRTITLCSALTFLMSVHAAPPDDCMKPPVTGPCQAATRKYYYDPQSHNCKSFIYGGCLGNSNRFSTRQECLRTCPKYNTFVGITRSPYLNNGISGDYEKALARLNDTLCPGPNMIGVINKVRAIIGLAPLKSRWSCGNNKRNVCLQEPEKGPCNARIPKFYYNAFTKTCEMFVYGGCLGNDNRFYTQQECQDTCTGVSMPLGSKKICHLLPETGLCKAFIPQYFYNYASQKCETFIYGGCGGNENRFDSQMECEKICDNIEFTKSLDVCLFPPKTGPCQANFTKFYFDQSTGRCEEFVYGGCQGNKNRFNTQHECQERCKVTPQKNSSILAKRACLLPPETGPCRARFSKFYFNPSKGLCEEFVYGGCQGNDNKFDSHQECQSKCQNTSSMNLCILLPEAGVCRAFIPQYFYNSTSQICETFIYGGCGGNANRFESKVECEGECRNNPSTRSQDVCLVPAETGPCRARIPKVYFNASTGTCEQFIYGGCQGNDNRFSTQQECQERCQGTSPLSPRQISGSTCSLPPETGQCRAFIPSYFYNATSGTCDQFIYGGCDGNDNRFDTETQCLQKCQNTTLITSRNLPEICSLPAETGLCIAYFQKFHFNLTSRKCEQFVYGGCGGNDNRFDTEEDCQRKCDLAARQRSGAVCLLQPETGPCRAMISRFFYNASKGSCEEFIYGGCQGNDNNFVTQQECQESCQDTPSTSQPRAPNDTCLLPPETGPCRAYMPRYFHNATSGTCEEFIYGGCKGNENRFATQLVCQERCRDTLPKLPPGVSNDICLLPPETGPCRASIPKFYHNASTGKCEEFIYGGCEGNQNNFNTQQQCQERCRDSLPPKQPENVCNLPPESGLCYAYFPRYFYNSTSRMCEEFIYGGCGGNENRFESQVECEGKCMSMASTKLQDVCLYPPEIGPCRASIPMFYHNASTGRCEEFIYGGCQGNDNKFDSQQECQERCRDKSIFGSNITSHTSQTASNITCLLPPETGQCRASIPSYFYNATSGTCNQFIYGGCDGNDNRFDTETQCLQKCQNTALIRSRNLPEICSLPAETGLCNAYFQKFHFNLTSRKCEQFVYGGCGGNDNRFDTEEDCQRKCDLAARQRSGAVCLLQPETGPCRAMISRFFYNASKGSCEEFIYGGCQGNDNNFVTQQECQESCQDTPSTSQPRAPNDTCLLPSETGPCRAYMPRYFHNATSGTCEEFIYGGCKGNENRFATRLVCQERCRDTLPKLPPGVSNDICLLPPETGPCRASIPKFYHNASTGKCEEFIYGGCEGNQNNFNTQQQCQERCRDSLPPKQHENVCNLPPESGLCYAYFPRYFYNSTSRMCDEFIYGGCGGNENRFESQVECEGKCMNMASTKLQDVCLYPPEIGPCRAIIPKFYHNASTGRCEEFIYGGCQGNDNKFDSQQECQERCRDKSIFGSNITSHTSQTASNITCLLPPETGQCRASIPSYFYNATSGTCNQFIYGGCDGNDNRFDTETQCLQKCQNTALIRSRNLPEICGLRAETGLCNAYFQKFHFNLTSRKCEQFVYGGCGGNDNRFDTEEDCQRKCDLAARQRSGAVCLLQPETGPCRAMISRFFYNASKGSCEEFIYGGCQGNDNNFITQQECQESCQDTPSTSQPRAPNDTCLLPPETGPCRAYMPRYFHNATSGTCEEFIYGGCKGNENRFATRLVCQERCRDTLPKLPSGVSNDICLLPPEIGACRASIPKFYHNASTGKCEEFIYGGCEGNQNNFNTQQQCQERCRDSLPPKQPENVCNLPPESGLCYAYFPRYFYNSTSRMCEEFIYGGCGGNENRFESQVECEGKCMNMASTKLQDVCLYPPEIGPCRASIPMFYHNASTGRCEEFIYGGCQGNDNKFDSQQECQERCRDKSIFGSNITSHTSQTASNITCLLPPETGQCRASIRSYFYNATSGTCNQFIYGGCDGNDNRFDTETQCLQKCQNTALIRSRNLPEICSLPAETGLCNAYFQKFHFNLTSRKCEQFVYGGCRGNDNRFDTEEDCQRKCDLAARQRSGAVCLLQPETGPCRAMISRFFYNASKGSCEEFIYGGCQGNDNNFITQQECQESCQDTPSTSQPRAPNDTCLLPPETGPCRAYMPRYFHNATSGTCEEFIYGGCKGNENRFATRLVCQERCRDTLPKLPSGVSNDICLLPPEIGPCRASIPKFYHNASTGKCEEFIYGGCEGNQNNFNTQQQCQERCRDSLPPKQPENVCNLPPESGLCYAYFPRYFYNSTSRMCEEFIYGGCGGNENRFESQVECEGKCMNMASTKLQDVCLYPPEIGPCRASIPMFYHNASTGRCEEFIYGGCQGNDNKFDSQQECQERCRDKSIFGSNITSHTSQTASNITCLLPPETGQCRASIRSYFYNATSGTCNQFIYGGCDGNDNRFDTETQCLQKCQNTALIRSRNLPEICSLPAETGLCNAYFQKFHFNLTSRKCEQFVYGGCGGNDNRFDTEEDCQRKCDLAARQRSGAVCLLQPETGPCRAMISRFFYNASKGSCEEFIYGGCQGNDNNFITQQECQESCQDTPSTSQPRAPNDTCLLPPETGPCRAYMPRYFHNATSGTCEEFIYGGCKGNENRFATRLVCQERCRDTLPKLPSGVSNDICLLPPEIGPCRASIPKFYHNASTGKCEEFIYGGCEGNQNNFNTQQQCQERCRDSLPPKQPENVCNLPPESGLCYAYFPRYFYNSTSRMCEEFIYGGCGGNENRFESQVECEGKCMNMASTKLQDVCLYPPDIGPCRASIPMFYHNASTGRCEEFIYGGCQGNDNKFDSQQECQERCRDKSIFGSNITSHTSQTASNITCLLPPETGQCRASIPSYFYNATSGTCNQFIYGGCDGNDNRFDTETQCLQKCQNTALIRSRNLPEICSLPAETGLCKAYFQKFHFNLTSRKCEQFVYGGCGGNDNRFDTEEDCQRKCDLAARQRSGAVCLLQPETGPCRAMISRFFYNASKGSCEEFIYGGCQGNDNNFITQQECQESCQDTPSTSQPRAPNDTCLLPPETGPCRAYMPRYFHNATSGTCEEFIYGGCKGNENRFATRLVCQERCRDTLPKLPSGVSNDICLLPPEIGPCRASIPKFYHNASTGKCEEFIYGGCEGNQNNFNTQQQCQERCRDSLPPKQPENVCNLPSESGLCYAYFPRYFYNSTSRMCEEFIYGGCGGNENRFESQVECEGKCMNMASTKLQDVCLYPPEIGPCRASIPMFYHNASTGRCEEFIYGGCQGNDNKFDSQQECQERCRDKSIFGSNITSHTSQTASNITCLLPPETGQCRASIPSYFYNATSGTCNQFIYGGCDGNDNRFDTETQCLQKCQNTALIRSRNLPEICSLPAETGLCNAYFQKFHFNLTSRKCEQFVYGGCGGNDNRFDTEEDCQRKCDLAARQRSGAVCLLKSETGPCRAMISRFFYNASKGSCEEFIYGGCQGNDNNFVTQQECQESCQDTPSTSQPRAPNDTCLLPPETGPCRAYMPRYFHNATSGTCEEFIYGGCKGNENRFATQLVCQERCRDTLPKLPPGVSNYICLLPPETGPCRASIPKFYHNASTGKCEEFIYGGCEGNQNNFNTQQQCQERCRDSLPTKQPENVCNLPPESGLCRAAIPRYFYNSTSEICQAFIYGGCGGNDNRFESEVECERACNGISSTRSQDVCLLPAETGPCRASIPKFYHNASTGTCEEFVYGGCDGNENNFNSQQECQETCRDSLPTKQSEQVCNLPQESGPCYAYFPRYFYNSTSRTCEKFIYGGCGGNDNRFESQVDCEGACRDVSTTRSQDVCLLPSEVGPCRASIPKFYHNASTGTCEEFVYGGCQGNDNRFDSQQECQDTCKDTHLEPPILVSNDTCLLPAETGPCKAYIPSHFYNATSGTCEEFIYGGCQGNDNRFATKQECQENCLDNPQQAVSNNICQLLPESGPCKAFMPQYFYNFTSRSCQTFIYGGCDGNDNRFVSESECLQNCGQNEKSLTDGRPS